ncbi:hypothetical protein H4W32_007206 [Actinophytocola algeriensis]|uniref:Uncharacterized protein n=1 Tax=Actinophytocola algeriensis TaxID=1768010 RepID=A0A7W7QCP4_9PSEU|nr:hypothetical protein [Actinophytocola algeriensis]MBE1479164.1 hypothetical protein [Actinophytocola algeriensis]
MEYLEHTGSGCSRSPGVSKDGYWGETLFTR